MLLIAAVSTVLALDHVIGSFMISRPFISGILIGYLMGDIKTGLLIGTIFELIWIDVFPIGTYVSPELVISSVLSVYWVLAQGGTVAFHTIALAMALAVPCSMIFRLFDIWNRQFNNYLVSKMEKKVDEGDEGAVSFYVYLSIFVFALKAFSFFVVFLPAGNLALDWLEGIMPAMVKHALDDSMIYLPVLGLAVGFNFFQKKKYESN